ncbi:MAG TPA: hypothetical protein VGS79_00485 [Puia sp.]|nr:hypothetical protein [Puia sp.]
MELKKVTRKKGNKQKRSVPQTKYGQPDFPKEVRISGVDIIIPANVSNYPKALFTRLWHTLEIIANFTAKSTTAAWRPPRKRNLQDGEITPWPNPSP